MSVALTLSAFPKATYLVAVGNQVVVITLHAMLTRCTSVPNGTTALLHDFCLTMSSWNGCVVHQKYLVANLTDSDNVSEVTGRHC